MKRIIHLKNWLKVRLHPDSVLFRIMRVAYAKLIYPIEHRAWQDNVGAGFESEKSLHMCSLLPRKTVDLVLKLYAPKTWLDVGCGTGAALKYVQRCGLDIWGFEYSALAIRESGISEKITRVDLTSSFDLSRRFDLVWCYEVAEHLPEQAADALIDTLCKHSAIVALSAAVPGQGGEGHINEQPQEYWIQKMAARGYLVDREATAAIQALDELFSANLVCYRCEQSLLQ